MKSHLRIVLLLFLIAGSLGDDGFNLLDALGDPDPTPPKPTEKPKAPEKPKNDGGLDLLDAFGPATTVKPKNPSSGDTGGFGFNLDDALGPDSNPKPDKPAVNPPNSGGGHAEDPGYDPHGGADQPQDPDLPWGQILKMLNANMPEEFYMWMSNLKQNLMTLLERAMNLLQAIP